MEAEETFWMDDIGDQLEAEGVDPGRIFEWHTHAFPKCEPGGIVVLNEKAQPGKFEYGNGGLLIFVKEIIVRENHPTGKIIHRLPPRNPEVLRNWTRIQAKIC